MKRTSRVFVALMLNIGLLSNAAIAAEADDAGLRASSKSGTIAIPTMGGRQFWSDVFAQAGWRIQENAITGHFRLLGPEDKRHQWGSYEACFEAFKNISNGGGPVWAGSHLVIMIHGLARTKNSFEKLGNALEAEGYSTLAMSYASTRGNPVDHAKLLNRLIDNLQGIEQVSFVTHSYGGLVLRQTLAMPSKWRNRIKVFSIWKSV